METVRTHIDPATFREFALFDALGFRRLWRRPLVFALLMSLFAALAFSRAGTTRGAGLLGGVLLGVGLGLPLVYFGVFLASVVKQSKAYAGGLDPYTVTLDKEGFTVEKEGQTLSCPWTQLHRACRLDRSVVLYAEPRRAYLLTGDLDRLWTLADRLAREQGKAL